ncbi:hypothetical protein DFH28DRAFT_1108706 [Melampsora americana]|nr:hypothetical protein DFH28DRAFT_1108706 [Melampsora americana]
MRPRTNGVQLTAKALLILTTIPLLARLMISDSMASENADLTTSQLIDKANSLLASGLSTQALELFDLALDRNPDDYLTLYKKATTQMSLGHYNHASTSFQKVLDLKDFDKARIQLAKIYLKLGDLDACKSQIDTHLAAGKDVSSVISTIQTDLAAARKHLKACRTHLSSKKWDSCVEEATAAIQHSPQNAELRQIRSDCHLARGHIQEAAGDLTRVAQLNPNSGIVALKVSLLSSFFLGQPLSQSIAPIKKCLHSDPESKPCKKAFRLLKAIDKEHTKLQNFMQSEGYRSAIKILNPRGKESEGLLAQVQDAIKSSQVVDSKSGIEEPLISSTIENLDQHSQLLTTLYSYTCKAYIKLNEIEKSKSICTILHERDPNEPWGLVGKAEVLMKSEEWEEAVKLLRQAYEQNEEQDIGERLRKAQKGLKVSKQKDYYKVLGVSRTADQKTLKKAYRKATLKAHPDKGGSQAKMTALNEAYEVLSNPELRARYDNGDDPNDPTSGGGGNPFQHGGNPIFQQFFQQQAGGGHPFGGGNPFGGSGGGQTFSFKFG